MYHEIRRKDRVLDEKGAIELLETAEYGFPVSYTHLTLPTTERV